MKTEEKAGRKHNSSFISWITIVTLMFSMFIGMLYLMTMPDREKATLCNVRGGTYYSSGKDAAAFTGQYRMEPMKGGSVCVMKEELK